MKEKRSNTLLYLSIYNVIYIFIFQGIKIYVNFFTFIFPCVFLIFLNEMIFNKIVIWLEMCYVRNN